MEFLDYLFPSFISFFIVLVSLILSTTLIIKERVSNSHIRNMVSNAHGFTFILGAFITVLFIVLFQCLMMFGIVQFFLNLPLLPHLTSLFIILLLSIAVFSILGMVVGYLFNSQETAIITSISLALFFIIFSSLISPLETMPLIFKSVLSYTPLILIENIFRKILIFETGLLSNLFNLIILSILFVSLFIITNLIYFLTKHKEIK